MGENYAEVLVERKGDMSRTVKRFIIVMTAVMLSVLMFVTLRIFSVMTIALVIYFAKILYSNTYHEYEYTYLNGEMTVDIIKAKRKRKRVKNIRFSTIEIMAPKNSPRLRSYENRRNIRTLDYSSGVESNSVYEFILSVDEVMTRVLFEPTEAIIEDLKYRFPGKIFKD